MGKERNDGQKLAVEKYFRQNEGLLCTRTASRISGLFVNVSFDYNSAPHDSFGSSSFAERTCCFFPYVLASSSVFYQVWDRESYNGVVLVAWLSWECQQWSERQNVLLTTPSRVAMFPGSVMQDRVLVEPEEPPDILAC